MRVKQERLGVPTYASVPTLLPKQGRAFHLFPAP